MARRRPPRSRKHGNSSSDDGLTPRETEVLHWIAQGKSNKEIGQILHMECATVGKHLERIYPKLGVDNRTAAAAVFLRRERG